jgi:polysaccharide biosynthesis protein VpsQ
MVKRITILYLLFLVGIIIIANLGLFGRLFIPVSSIPGGDKTGHFLLMGILSFLATLTMAPRRFKMGRLTLPLGSVCVAIVVTMEEFSQIFIRSRGFSWGDLAADYCGIICFGIVATLILARKKTNQ